jgi:hypothetical protein
LSILFFRQVPVWFRLRPAQPNYKLLTSVFEDNYFLFSITRNQAKNYMPLFSLRDSHLITVPVHSA